jgi:hypothetical protein
VVIFRGAEAPVSITQPIKTTVVHVIPNILSVTSVQRIEPTLFAMNARIETIDLVIHALERLFGHAL